MMMANRLALYAILATTFTMITGFGVAVYTLARYFMGAPTSFEYLSGLWFLASVLGASYSIALLVSPKSNAKKGLIGVFVLMLFIFWILFFEEFYTLFTYPLARFLIYLNIFNLAVALFLYGSKRSMGSQSASTQVVS